jgi:hypothetical protein
MINIQAFEGNDVRYTGVEAPVSISNDLVQSVVVNGAIERRK